jgi:integrase/recombinase XerC
VKTIDGRKGEKAGRDALLIALILNTGLRVSEALGLDLADVNVAEKQLTVAAKGGETHKVFINARTRRRLAAYLKKRKKNLAESPALFLSNRGQRLSVRQAQALVEQWLAEAGIAKSVTVHGLRHTFATHLLERTGNLRTVQEALRHRNIATTVRYTHQPSEVLTEALEAL